MAFSEQVQQLCAEVSAEQAESLREYIVNLTERTEVNPGVLNTGLEALMQEATEEGFDADELLATLLKLTSAALQAEDQTRFAADIEAYLAHNTRISEITVEISSGYPDLKAETLRLLEAAKTETRTLTGVAGGTSHNGDFKKTWQKTPNATKKQKWEKRGIDILEAGALLSVLSRTGYAVQYRLAARKAAAAIKKLEEDPFTAKVPEPSLGKGFKHWTFKDGLLGPSAHENWETKASSAYSELKKWVPGHVVYNFIKNKYGENPPSPTPNDNDGRVRRSYSYLSEHESGVESDIDSVASDINPRRLELEISNNSLADRLYANFRPDNNPSVKIHPHLRAAWNSMELPDLPSLDPEAMIAADVKSVATGIGKGIEDGLKSDMGELISADKDLIDSIDSV